MDVDDWHDPLLITDASSSQQISLNFQKYYPFSSSMEGSGWCTPMKIEEGCNNGNIKDPVAESVINGRDMLGFSLTSPDLVICTGSPDIPARSYGDSPEFLKACSISLENGIKGSEEAQAETKLLTNWQGSKDEDLCLQAHFELPSPPGVGENSSEMSVPIVSINVGSTECINSESGIRFSEDKYFNGGDVLSTDTRIEGNICTSVYQTARVGNFSYHFNNITAGFYLVDLHFVEVVLTDGSIGDRVFDVYIQEQKVILSLHILARVGANKPLLNWK